MLDIVRVGEHTVKARGLGRGVRVEVPCSSTEGYVDSVRKRQHTPPNADSAVEVCCEGCGQHFLVTYQGGGLLGITRMRT